MTVKVTLSCDGCHIECGPYMYPHREFHGVTGRSHGFGHWHQPGLEVMEFPEGWIASDPYTGCTYCPECWADITAAAGCA